MTILRSAAGALALGTLFLMFSLSDAAAQGDRRVPKRDGAVIIDAFECPKCGKEIESRDGTPPTVCPHWGAKLEAVKSADGTYSLKYTESSENKWKKPLIYGGGVLLVLGLIGVALKYTVFKPKPQKKKKKRRDDDDDEDRPRKKKRPVAEDDDDDDRPRKVKKKPRIVDEDDD